MGFKPKEVSNLLVACNRMCCICHRWCGQKMQIHHISGREDDSIDNAIPLCLECHAEMSLYDDKHAIGRKYTKYELQQHKKKWLETVENNPEIITEPFKADDTGPLHALLDELQFNENIQKNHHYEKAGCYFETKQFDRILSEGYLSMLHNDVASSLMETYRKLKAANLCIDTLVRARDGKYINRAQKSLDQAISNLSSINDCSKLLKKYLLPTETS